MQVFKTYPWHIQDSFAMNSRESLRRQLAQGSYVSALGAQLWIPPCGQHVCPHRSCTHSNCSVPHKLRQLGSTRSTSSGNLISGSCIHDAQCGPNLLAWRTMALVGLVLDLRAWRRMGFLSKSTDEPCDAHFHGVHRCSNRCTSRRAHRPLRLQSTHNRAWDIGISCSCMSC